MNRLSRKYSYIAAGLVGLITVLVYLPALSNGFVNWDDEAYVVDNANIRLTGLRLLSWVFSEFYFANWHPLTLLSHAADYALWGLNPLGHHLTSVALHGLNTFLLVLLVFRLMAARGGNSQSDFLGTRALTAAIITGLLFGVHPIHVESVAWVSERKDLLCAFFFILSLLAYVDYIKGISSSQESGSFSYYRKKYYLVSLVCFILALMSKPMALTLPAVLLILDWYPFSRKDTAPKKLAMEKIPFFVLSLASAVLTLFAQASSQAIIPFDKINLPVRILTGIKAVIVYLLKIIWPFGLSPFYPYPKTVFFPSYEYVLPLLLFFGITFAAVFLVKRRRIWTSLWAYYLVTLLPVLGIIQVGAQSMADRYTYLPSIAPFLAIGLSGTWTYENISKRTPGGAALKIFFIAAAISVSVFLAYLTIDQIGIWKNSFTLWNYVIERDPGITLAHNNLGAHYLKVGAIDKAEAEYSAALKLDPDDAGTHYNLGLVYMRQKRLDDAITEYKASLKLNPDNAKAHNNLGLAYIELGRSDIALQEYETSILFDPDYAEAHNNAGVIYEEQGRAADAIREYRTAIRLNPEYGDAHYNLGCLYASSGRPRDAEREFREALRLNPGDAEARRQLEML